MSAILYPDSELQMDTRLILCIEEHDNPSDKSSIDNRIFIGWDINTEDYYIRGKRLDTRTSHYVPYALRCDTTCSVTDFIEFVTGNNFKSVTLYNYNNLEGKSIDVDITYEFFEENMDKYYEIAAYDYIKLYKRKLTSYLQMLRDTYNYYD